MRNINTGLIVSVIAVVSILLVGNMYGLKWAGGDGNIDHISISGDDHTYERNEPITTGDDYLKITVSESDDSNSPMNTIFISKNSELKFTSTDETNIVLQVVQGEVIIDGALDINVQTGGLVTTHKQGITAITFYSWLLKTDVTNVFGDAALAWNEETKELSEESLSITFDTSDRNQSTSETFEFSSEDSVSSDFYTWTELDFEN